MELLPSSDDPKLISRILNWLRGIDVFALVGLIAIALFMYWMMAHYTNAIS